MAKLALTFLGTGTSNGVPVIGCNCPVCLSQDSKDNRLRTSVQLQTEQICIVIDTPPDFRIQFLRENIQSVDAVLYTHAHADHILGFDDLRHFCERKDLELPIYGIPETIIGIKKIFPYAFEKIATPLKGGLSYVQPSFREIREEFKLGDLQIVPVNLPHGEVTTVGFVFHHAGRKALAYYTDCSYLPKKAKIAAKGVEVLVIDALRYTPPHPTHLTVQGALKAAKGLDSRTCYFTHMGHELKYAKMQSHLPSGFFPAYDGLRVYI